MHDPAPYHGVRLGVSRRVRATPYTPRIEELGVTDYSVVNHTVLPKGFGRSVEEDYWHLRSHVQLWDVSCQRQVQLRGPDAARLTQMMTPRDLRNAQIGQCLYAPLVDEAGGMLNDPVILKLGEDRLWLSIADSDVLLWASGLATGLGLQVTVDEPDVWPLAVQGPRADDLMAAVFGDNLRRLRFFRFAMIDFRDHPLLIARSGYSRQGGFEIYLDEPALGLELWDRLWDAGTALDVRPGCPNLIERIEGGLLSYGNEMTRAENPLECGLSRFCQLDGSIDFIGRNALVEAQARGVQRAIRGVLFDGGACPPVRHPWPIRAHGRRVGQITSAIWSPRFHANVSLGMLDRDCWHTDQRVVVTSDDGLERNGRVVALPFVDAVLAQASPG